jgi:Ca-activated chloride channel family protein
MRTLIALSLIALAVLPARAVVNLPDRTESPYFLVRGGGKTESLPLKSTVVRARVAGVIADVTVVQEYSNTGTAPIEAVYVFPASTRAAVHAMKMTIGGRVRIAKVMEKAKAAATYSQAKHEGKSAALLEQERANVFRMSVANVLPGDVVVVELSYTETLIPRDGVYELAYPTVVGPRYEGASGTQGAGFGQVYTRPGIAPRSTFAFSADIAAGLPLGEVTCATHPVEIARTADTARIALPAGPHGDRDLVLSYRLSGERIASGLLLSEDAHENFFLLTVQPPVAVAPADLPAREYVFVVDVSGSMHGFPLEVTRALMKELLGGLTARDSFNLMTFSGGNTVLAPRPLAATKENVTHALEALARETGSGSTELLPALKEALALPRAPGKSRSLVVVTDGFVACEAEAFQLVRANLGTANLFALGIGSSVNRHLVEGLARAGEAEPFVITSQAEAPAAAAKLRRYATAPVMTDVRVAFDGFEAYDLEPRWQPDLLAERPVVVCGKWRGRRAGSITVSGLAAGRRYSQTYRPADVTPSRDLAALKYLWARRAIARLTDDQRAAGDTLRADQITKLGLAYHLLTDFTSFVAVDEIVRNPTGVAKTVNQPLPLARGVSGAATQAFVGAAPEPETWALLIVALLAIAAAMTRKELFA